MNILKIVTEADQGITSYDLTEHHCLIGSHATYGNIRICYEDGEYVARNRLGSLIAKTTESFNSLIQLGIFNIFAVNLITGYKISIISTLEVSENEILVDNVNTDDCVLVERPGKPPLKVSYELHGWLCDGYRRSSLKDMLKEFSSRGCNLYVVRGNDLES